MNKLIKNNVFWTGKIDWELRKFHGDEYSTNRGSSYNSYLIKEEKNVLIDTVWLPYAKEFVENLKQEINLKDIDYIIANHSEIDHSGALPLLMKEIPDTPIFCTNNGVKILKGHYHKDWNFNVVKTGDKLKIGNNKEIIFIEIPMLHWPDSMMSYLTGDNILFSNDAFGQHYANDFLFNDLSDQEELFYEALKYYANILTPFSKILINKLNQFKGLNLPVDIIAPSHGIIWRENPAQIIEQYASWANAYQENQITIIYDTMWQGTRRLAEAIAQGIRNKDKEVKIKIYNASKTDKNDLIVEIFKSKMILIGSSTVNNGILTSIAGILEEIKGMKFKNKKAAAFGCYGWSGEAVKIINKQLEEAKFELVNEGLRVLWNPDEEARKKVINFGEHL